MPCSSFLRPRAPGSDVGSSGGGHGPSSTQIEPLEGSRDAIIRVVREENMHQQPCLHVPRKRKFINRVQKLQLTTFQSILISVRKTLFEFIKMAQMGNVMHIDLLIKLNALYFSDINNNRPHRYRTGVRQTITSLHWKGHSHFIFIGGEMSVRLLSPLRGHQAGGGTSD
jgi:uncharacterized protein (UPF0276 family)